MEFERIEVVAGIVEIFESVRDVTTRRYFLYSGSITLSKNTSSLPKFLRYFWADVSHSLTSMNDGEKNLVIKRFSQKY